MQIEFIRLIDRLLKDAPQTRKTLELKEEMVQNLMEKYQDLLLAGKSEKDAFTIAAASIGDLDELARTLRREAGMPEQAREAEPFAEEDAKEETFSKPETVYAPPPESARERAARLIASAVMFFVLSPVPYLFFSARVASFLLLAMIACGIGLLVYSAALKPGRYGAEPDTETDPRSESTRGRHLFGDEAEKAPGKGGLRGALSGAYWLLITALYIVFSFRTGLWYISWVIFLFAPALQNVVLAVTAPTRRKMLSYLSGALWTATTGIYFVISFASGQWHLTWIIFLIATALNNTLRALMQLGKRGGKHE